MKHIIRSQDFDAERLDNIFLLADSFRNGNTDGRYLNGKVLCSLFYEPSTRTRLSFESAHLRLGGSVIGTDNAGEFSSAIKGESLEDSIRVISSYADVIVLRHSSNDAAERAEKVSNCSIINAGSGTGQHPTQSLTDLYTIRHRIGRIDGINIALVGDLKHGRTVKSLAYLLGKYQDVIIHFVSPHNLQIDAGILDYLDRHGVGYRLTDDLDQILGSVDVVYQTRLQKERHGTDGLVYDYRIDKSKLENSNSRAVIMHPLPRNDEISVDVDEMPNAAYFEQAANSLWVRMALLHHIMRVDLSP